MGRENEWVPAIPRCGRCDGLHWREFLTLVEGVGWVGDPCLTEKERAAWCRPEDRPRGKVDVPIT